MNPNDLDLNHGNGGADDEINAAFGSLRHDATQLNPPGAPTGGGGMTTALPVLLLVALIAVVGGFFALWGGDDSTVLSNDPEIAAPIAPTEPTSEDLPQTTVTNDPDTDGPSAPSAPPTTRSDDHTNATATTGASIAEPPSDEGTATIEPPPDTVPVPATDPGLIADPAVDSGTVNPEPVPGPSEVSMTPMAVVGVAADDVLNARGEPGADSEALGTIPPFSTSITRYDDNQGVVVGGSTWNLIGNPDARDFDAWVNSRFLTEITGDSDQPRSFYNAVSDVREALSLDNSHERIADYLVGSRSGPVVISADGYFDDDDQSFDAAELNALSSPNDTIVRWGFQDGSGDPIDATVEQFFEALAATPALTKTEQVGVNERIHFGNLIDNAAEYFVGATIVELHYGGDEGDMKPFTWDTIRLAFQPGADNDWHLVGIAHDTWTI